MSDIAKERMSKEAMMIENAALQTAQQADMTIPKSVECPFCASEFVPRWLYDHHFYKAEQPAQPQQEPVAWNPKDHYNDGWKDGFTAALAQRKPLVWLSEEDERQIKDHCTTVACVLRAVKAKLKENNTCSN